MEKYVLAYMTVKDKAEAVAIGKTLLEKRIVACINFWDGMESLYWWEGKMETASEVVLIAKTTIAHKKAVVATVKALHSYSCPCVLFLPIDGGNEDYLKWLADNVSSLLK